MAWSPDSRHLATGTLWGFLIQDVSANRELKRQNGIPHVRSLAWSPDGKFLAAAGGDGRLVVWEFQTGERRWQVDGEGVALDPVVWSPDGKSIVAASVGRARVFDAITGRQRLRFDVHSSRPAIAFGPDSRTIFTASQHAPIRVWDAATGRPLRGPETPFVPGAYFEWNADHSAVAYVSGDATWVWKLAETRPEVTSVHWADENGWVTWRAGFDADHRVTRGENGKLLVRRGPHDHSEPIAPLIGLHPQLTALARVLTSAGVGELGEVRVDVTNSKDATEAIWLELREPKPFMRNLSAAVSFTFPPTTIRLGPGQTVTLPVQYRRYVDEPAPEHIKTAFDLHYANDRGKAIAVPVTLPFRSARVVMNTGFPVSRGDEVTLPITISNFGDQSTGSRFHIAAKVGVADRGVVYTWTNDLGPLAPGATHKLSLKVPVVTDLLMKLKLELTATQKYSSEGQRESEPGADGDSLESIVARDERSYRKHCIHIFDDPLPVMDTDGLPWGPRVSWTYRSNWMRPRPWYLGYVGGAVGMALLVGAAYWMRTKRKPA
jgi:hypothetical protein